MCSRLKLWSCSTYVLVTYERHTPRAAALAIAASGMIYVYSLATISHIDYQDADSLDFQCLDEIAKLPRVNMPMDLVLREIRTCDQSWGAFRKSPMHPRPSSSAFVFALT